MKIEKLNDNQIRCTLNSSDLHARHMSLLELAYGTEKARLLFHEMLELADAQVGFHTEDFPLMIEAIPLGGDNIVLMISKIEDPDELDTRFARFAPGIDGEENNMGTPAGGPVAAGSAGDILEAISRMVENISREEETPKDLDVLTVFRFGTLNDLLKAARILKDVYSGRNSLYHSQNPPEYFLAVHKSGHSPEEFNKICNILTEYGSRVQSNSASEAYFREHLQEVVPDRALQSLAV